MEPWGEETPRICLRPLHTDLGQRDVAATVPTRRSCPPPVSALRPVCHVCVNSRGEDQRPISQRRKPRPRGATRTWGQSEGAESDPGRSGWRPALPPGRPLHTMSTCRPRVHSMPLMCPAPPGSAVAAPACAAPRPTPQCLFLRRSQLELKGQMDGRAEGQATSRHAGGPVTEAAGCALAQGGTQGRIRGGEGTAPTRGPCFAGGRAAPGWNLASGKDMNLDAPHQAPLWYPGRHD